MNQEFNNKYYFGELVAARALLFFKLRLIVLPIIM